MSVEISKYHPYVSLCDDVILLTGPDTIFTDFREQEKALKAAAAGASKKGPMGGGGIKKSGKK